MANASWYVGAEHGGFPEARPSGGMFGSRTNWPALVSGFLNNFSAAQGNPAALAAVQAQYQAQREGRQARSAEMERRQGLEDRFSLFQREQEYRQSHPDTPQPTELERYMRAAGIDPASPQGRALFSNAANNQANPMTAIDVQQPDGSVVRQWVRPGPSSNAPAVLNSLPPNAVPIGGAASGPRPFR